MTKLGSTAFSEITDTESDINGLIVSVNKINHDTLVNAANDITLALNDVLHLREHTTGKGGGDIWDVKLLSSVTLGLDTIAWAHNTGAGTDLALQLRVTGWLNIKSLGAPGDGSDSTAIEQFAAANYDFILVPDGTYLRTGKVSIRAGQMWYMANPLYIQDGVTFVTIFEADDISDWGLMGRTRCKGSLVTSADTGPENGLVIKGCTRYTVENYHSSNMRSHGVHIQAGTLAPTPRGDQGQINFCSGHESQVGIEVDADTTAEFNIITGFTAAGNQDGVIVGAGNTSFIGGNCVDNLRGFTVKAGFNHAHGITSGMHINHNTSWNIKTISVTNGHTFDTCHAYGNGGTTAPIIFENSKGITFQNGKLDCPVFNDGTTGQNAVLNNHLPGIDAQLLGTNKEFLRVLGNWTDLGAWIENDRASEYSALSRGVSTQAIPPTTVLIFNSADRDKRNHYNTTTGVYTAAVAGSYTIQPAITIQGTGFTAAGSSFIEIKKGATVISHIVVTPVSDTLLIGGNPVDVILAVGDTITLVSQVAGTAPLLSITTSRIMIELDS